MYGYSDYIRISEVPCTENMVVSGVFIFHSDLMKNAVAVVGHVVYKWSARYGNKRRWLRCRQDGVVLDGKPVDVLFWKRLTPDMGSLPTNQQLENEYFKAFPGKKKKVITYGTYEAVVAEGLDRLNPSSDYRLERHARVSGQPVV